VVRSGRETKNNGRRRKFGRWSEMKKIFASSYRPLRVAAERRKTASSRRRRRTSEFSPFSRSHNPLFSRREKKKKTSSKRGRKKKTENKRRPSRRRTAFWRRRTTPEGKRARAFKHAHTVKSVGFEKKNRKAFLLKP